MNLLTSAKFWIGLAISLLTLWLAVRGIPFDEFGRSLVGASYLWLLPAIVAQLLGIIARSWRWVVLLGKESRLSDSFWAQSLGYLFTNVLPFRAGEVARVVAMAQRCQLSVVRVAASAMLERLLDIGTMLFLLIMVLPWMKMPSIVVQAGYSFGLVVLLGSAILLAAARFGGFVEKLLLLLCQRLGFLPREQTVAFWHQLASGLVPLARRRVAVRSLLWSAVTWTCMIAFYWCVLRIFRPDATLVEAAFLQIALSLAVAVPSSPGFVGVFQLVGQQSLVLPFEGKYDPASALAIILTAHLSYYLFTTGLGILGLWKLGETFGSLGRSIAMSRSPRRITT